MALSTAFRDKGYGYIPPEGMNLHNISGQIYATRHQTLSQVRHIA